MNRLPAPGLDPGFSDEADASPEGDIAALVELEMELTRALGVPDCVSTAGMWPATAALAACSWWMFFLDYARCVSPDNVSIGS